MMGRPALDFVAADQRERVAAVMNAGAELTYETAVLHADGTRMPVEFIVRTMVYQGERLRMTIVRDLRDRMAARSRIDYLAHHDALTGLPNRTAFIERAEARGPQIGHGDLALLDLRQRGRQHQDRRLRSPDPFGRVFRADIDHPRPARLVKVRELSHFSQ